MERYILPALGSIKVTALGRDDVAALHHEMRKKSYQANRTLGGVEDDQPGRGLGPAARPHT